MRFPEWSAVRSDPSEGVDCTWIMCGAMVIGSVDGPQSDERQSQRAKLIAAAPDMYEALAAFVGMQSTDDVSAIIEQAEAALAKARGEQQG